MNGHVVRFLLWVGLATAAAILRPLQAAANLKNDDGSPTITVAVTDMAGVPVAKSGVALVLKSGAHQKGVTDAKGEVRLQKPSASAQVWAAGFGYEARAVNYHGEDKVTIALDKREGFNSAIVHGSTELEGTGGAIEVHYGDGRNPYMYGTPLGFIQNGKKAAHPVHFKPRQAVITVSPDGRKFKIYVRRGVEKISLVEYTLPGGS